MQSDRPPSDSSYPRDSRSIPPKRVSHYNKPAKRKQSSESESRQKRKDDDDDSDTDHYNFEKLKKFHIPRKKGKEEKELLTGLSLSAREYTHTIYPTFRSSFFDAQSSKKLQIKQVELVQNHRLEKEYLTKRKDLKDEGRSEKELSDSFGYVHYFKKSDVERVCKEGLMVGHSNIASLGKPDMGVYVCKHADIVRFSKWEDQQSGYIVMFKIIKGKTKIVTEGRTPNTDQEPTPLYDCHITKIPIDVAQSVHSRGYYASQYYFYEYGDIDVEKRPRQVLPYAVLKYTYEESSNSTVAASRTSRRESSLDDVFTDSGSMSSPVPVLFTDTYFSHWRGKLLVKNGTFCSVEIRTQSDIVFNVANIERNINIKACVSLDKLKRQLPPTLLSRSTKKNNVVYRGRTYNMFTLHSTEEGSGLGKFRQLIGHLVQRSFVAFVPLRNNSSLYLLPLSELTEEMGLKSQPQEPSTPTGSKQSQRAWKNFLHVIIITPKVLSSKINDQRLTNIMTTQKRKHILPLVKSTSVRDMLEHKLRLMNIEPSSALTAMDPDQHQKIYDRIKEKKKLPASDKMLHSHYKEVNMMSSSSKSSYMKSISQRWAAVTKLQLEFYSGKKKLKVIQSPPNMRSRSLSKNSDHTGEVTADDTTEATFSDDDEDSASKSSSSSSYKIPKKPRTEDFSRISDATEISTSSRPDPRMDRNKKSRLPLSYTPAINSPNTGSSVIRPAFKPLEELIFSGNLEELLKHPEFSFTEKYASKHTISRFSGPFQPDAPYVPWEENHPKISITFNQFLPYIITSADCPFAPDSDPIILSMLRAIHGEYDGTDDSVEDHDKVQWVRRILHNRDSSDDMDDTAPYVPGQLSGTTRKIIEPVLDKSSPLFTEASPHQSSTDSGFVSAATPGSGAPPEEPALKDLAVLIASALTHNTTASEPVPKDTTDTTGKDKEDSPDVELAAKAILQALTRTSNAETSQDDSENMDGIDMEIGSTPGKSPAKEKSLSRDAHLTSDTRLREDTVKSRQGSIEGPSSSNQHAQGPTSMSEYEWDRTITPPPAPPSFTNPTEDIQRSRDFGNNKKDSAWSHARDTKRRFSPIRSGRYSSHRENKGEKNVEEINGGERRVRYFENSETTDNGFEYRDEGRVRVRETDYYNREQSGEQTHRRRVREEQNRLGFHPRSRYSEQHRKLSLESRNEYFKETYREHQHDSERDWREREKNPPRRPGLLGNQPYRGDEKDQYYSEETFTQPRRRPALLGTVPGATEKYPNFQPRRRYSDTQSRPLLNERGPYRYNHKQAPRHRPPPPHPRPPSRGLLRTTSALLGDRPPPLLPNPRNSWR